MQILSQNDAQKDHPTEIKKANRTKGREIYQVDDLIEDDVHPDEYARAGVHDGTTAAIVAPSAQQTVHQA